MTFADFIVVILLTSGLALAVVLIVPDLIVSFFKDKQCDDCEHIDPRCARYSSKAAKQEKSAFEQFAKQEKDIFEQSKKSKKSSSKKSSKKKADEDVLPKSYRKMLSSIRSRAAEIRSRANDRTIEVLLSSWEESVTANTRNYIALANAPIKTDAIENAMRDIEKAVTSVLPALDDMLAQTYDKQCMAAAIEAGTLEAMIKQNRELMRDADVFSK